MREFILSNAKKFLSEAQSKLIGYISAGQSDQHMDATAQLSDDQKTVTTADGSTYKAIISGTPTKVEAAIRIDEGTFYVQHQVQKQGDISGGGKAYVILKDLLSMDAAGNRHHYIQKHNNITQFSLPVTALYQIAGTTYDSSKNKIVRVGFTPNGKWLFVGASEVPVVGGEGRLSWGFVRFGFDTVSGLVTYDMDSRIGDTLLFGHQQLGPAPTTPSIQPALTCTLSTFNGSGSSTYSYSVLAGPVNNPPALEYEVQTGGYAISNDGDGVPVVDLIGRYRSIRRAPVYFGRTGYSISSTMQMYFGRCSNWEVFEDYNESGSTSITWNTIGGYWDFSTSGTTSGSFSGSGCTSTFCEGGGGELSDPALFRSVYGPDCTAYSYGGSASGTRGTLGMPAGDPDYVFPSESLLNQLGPFITTSDVIWHHSFFGITDILADRKITHTSNIVTFEHAQGGNTCTYATNDEITEDNELSLVNPLSGFISITGARAALSQLSPPFGSQTLRYDSPYRTPLATPPSSPFIYTDTHLFQTSSPADWSEKDMVKAVDSEKFQSINWHGAPKYKKYRWDTLTSAVVPAGGFGGAAINTETKSVVDFIILGQV